MDSNPEMLLSRVAEHVYWAGRYLERAEATARLVRTHTELFIDLPRSVGLGWTPLLAVTGSDEAYRDVGTSFVEDEIVPFLLADPEHHSSVVTSVGQARENLRVTRALLPRRSWEVVNEMHSWVKATSNRGCARSARLMWTEDVIRRCHLVSGSVNATMSRDYAYSFLMLGRHIERADMTTRVLDVQAGIMMDNPTEALLPYADLTWMSMLRSLGGEQMFRRMSGGMVSGHGAVQFLLRETTFPRSVEHCLIETSRWLLELPHQETPMAGCASVQQQLEAVDLSDVSIDELHALVDELQEGLATLHGQVAETYFLSSRVAA